MMSRLAIKRQHSADFPRRVAALQNVEVQNPQVDWFNGRIRIPPLPPAHAVPECQVV